MSFNIKNAEAHALAKELAQRKGLSMTEVVTEALRRELAELDHQEKQSSGLAAKLLRIGREASASLKCAPVSLEALLYDDNGMPR
ncbi:MAG: type II toxin-antitoxin system VapB family antitoxin [Archangium sp.]